LDCYAPTSPGCTEGPFHFQADVSQTSDVTFVPSHTDLRLKAGPHCEIAAVHFELNIAHDPDPKITGKMVSRQSNTLPARAFAFQKI
jgi:hypothetical protein